MKEATKADLGMNKTGAKASPMDSKDVMEAAARLTTPPSLDEFGVGHTRTAYMNDSGPVGSVPIPTSLRGMASGVQEKIVNGNHIFMDKLGERIAFERTGTRLYEALISKYEGTESSVLPDKERLYQFHSEELSHFHLLVDVMEKLGGDPTAMTPCADVAGTAAFGWLQVISDPRTSFLQCLNVMLQAELTDNASWELLVKLADSTGLTDVADQFREAMVQEAVHLATVKQWVEELTINQKVLTKGIVSGESLSQEIQQ